MADQKRQRVPTVQIPSSGSMADFVKEYGLEGAVVRFPDGHEEPYETAVKGIALNGLKTLAECIEDSLPEGASLIFKE